MKRKDRELGMDRDITRRDFLSGVNIAVTGSLLATPLTQALAALEESSRGVSEQMMPGYYPPTREGLRGSHPGSFEVAHSLRDGEHCVAVTRVRSKSHTRYATASNGATWMMPRIAVKNMTWLSLVAASADWQLRISIRKKQVRTRKFSL